MKPIEITKFDYREIYQKNHFIVRTVDFSLEHVPESDLFSVPFAILTAWNPNNQATSSQINTTNNYLLEEELKQLDVSFDKAVGYLDGHIEKSFCVYDISFDKAIDIAQKFHQYSIFYNDTKIMGYYKVDTSRAIIEKMVPM